MSIASFRERFNDFRSCWVVFIHVLQEHPGGLLQFSKGEAIKIGLASIQIKKLKKKTNNLFHITASGWIGTTGTI